LRTDLKRAVERLAILNDRSLNSQIVLMLESAVLAEKAGVGGVDGVVRAVQAKAAANAVEANSCLYGFTSTRNNEQSQIHSLPPNGMRGSRMDLIPPDCRNLKRKEI
jgi:hypothetical protein